MGGEGEGEEGRERREGEGGKRGKKEGRRDRGRENRIFPASWSFFVPTS